MQKDNRKKKTSILFNIIVLILIGIIVFSGYKIVKYFYDSWKSENEFNKIRFLYDNDEKPAKETDDFDIPYSDLLPHYKELKEKNPDFIGWIKVKGTVINYPVMQKEGDLEFYLHRDFDQGYSYAGTPFASNISDTKTPSDVVILYGHEMKNGSMFAGLNKFSNSDFITQNQEIIFDTLDGRNRYKIYSLFKTQVDTGETGEFDYYNINNFKDEDAYNVFCQNMEMHNIIKNPNNIEYKFGDKAILLSTCDYAISENHRQVLVGIRFAYEKAVE